MYKERLVKKPRKTYICGICNCTIDGEHLYVAQVFEGVFHTSRDHIECSNFFKEHVCTECDECIGLSSECFNNSECDNCDKKYPEDEGNCAFTIQECIKEKLKKDPPCE